MRALVFTAFALLLCRGVQSYNCVTETALTAYPKTTSPTSAACASGKCYATHYKDGSTSKYTLACATACASTGTTMSCHSCETADCNNVAGFVGAIDCVTGTGLAASDTAGSSAVCTAGTCWQQYYVEADGTTKKYNEGCGTTCTPVSGTNKELGCKTCNDAKDCNNKAAPIAKLQCSTGTGVTSLGSTATGVTAGVDCANKCYQQWYRDSAGALKYNLGCTSTAAITDCSDAGLTAAAGTQLACALCENEKDCNSATTPIATTTTATTAATTAAGGATTTAAGGATTTAAGGATTTGAASVLASPALLLLASVMLLLFR